MADADAEAEADFLRAVRSSFQTPPPPQQVGVVRSRIVPSCFHGSACPIPFCFPENSTVISF